MRKQELQGIGTCVLGLFFCALVVETCRNFLVHAGCSHLLVSEAIYSVKLSTIHR